MEKKDKLPPPYYPLKLSNPSSSSSSFLPQTLEESSQRFSHDVSQMPDFPARNRGHRRAQSEILSLPDDLSFDADLGFLDQNDEMEEDFLAMYLDMDTIGSSYGSDVFGVENLGVQGGGVGGESSGSMQNERPRVRHQHSQSMDGSTSIKTELLGTGSEGSSSLAESKKEISAAKLADLALVDPKRAKRIWANRQSAARSKERKMRYIAELERKVQTLQTEGTTLSAQLTMLQRDTTGLTAENSELKLRLQTMEQQVHLQDALNDALREEVQRLKMATGQMMPNGPVMNFGYGGNQQFYHNNQNQAMQSLIAARQLQQLQIRPQHHQQQHTPSAADLRARGAPAPLNQRESNNPSSE